MFGSSEEDYIFITPPSQDYWGVLPRGNPMPNRSNPYIVSWEDPLYIEEWIREYNHLTQGRQYSRTTPIHYADVIYTDNNGIIHRFCSVSINKLNEGLSVSENHISSNSINSLAGLLYEYLSYVIKQYFSIPLPFWYNETIESVAWKFSLYSPIQVPKVVNKNIEERIEMLASAGYLSSFEDYDESDILKSVIDITPISEKCGIAIKNNLMKPSGSDYIPLSDNDNVSLIRKIPLTFFYCLQYLSNNIFFAILHKIVSVVIDVKKWDASALRRLTNNPTPAYYLPKYAGNGWNTPPGPDGQPTEYIELSYIKEGDNIYSTHAPEGEPVLDIIPSESEETPTSSNSKKILFYINRHDKIDVRWESKEGNWGDAPTVNGYNWNDEQNVWEPDVTFHTQYLVYTTDGLNKYSSCNIRKMKKLTFWVDDSTYVKYHNRTGIPNGNDFLEAKTFFLHITVEKINSFYDVVNSYGYPKYDLSSDSSSDDDNTSFDVVVPVDSSKVKLSEEIIDNGISKYSKWEIDSEVLSSIIENIMSLPQMKDFDYDKLISPDNIIVRDIDYPNQENIAYDVTDEYNHCNGNAQSRTTYNITMTIDKIYAAFQWKPFPGQGLNPISSSEI